MSTWRAIIEECRHMFSIPKLAAILLLMPVLYAVLFGFLYSHERITDMPVIVYDGDNSALSRQVIQAFDATDTFKVIGQRWNEEDVVQEVQNGVARVGLIIPPNFSSGLQHGENIPIMTFIDGSNMIYSNSASRIANQVIMSISSGATLQTLDKKGMSSEQAGALLNAIPYRSRVLYNPVFNYEYYMPIGVISAALQQCLLLGIALSCTWQKEAGLWHRFYDWRFAPWKLAIAKLTPYFLVGLVNVVVSFSIAHFGFGIPFVGQLWPMLILSLGFNFALCGLGFLFSVVSKRQVDAIQVLMLIAMPSFMLSGYTWPLEAMPRALRVIGECLPLTQFLQGVRSIVVKGLPMDQIWQNVIALGMIGLVTLLISFLIFPLTMRRYKEYDNESEHPTATLTTESLSK
ncbi:ABC transporter permease [Paenibacillus hunanensis]|uniref:ABC transporter permease n=1 Tax=Paenibacillus hunanensis TaxID=539262 RepID=UPI0020266F8B|nr:ABC transporter permease [Paenibacillus hunanensis]MCL9663073.1 ABC transporter permease [Paenibacillus hunanensis]